MIHPIFHVSLLRIAPKGHQVNISLPELTSEGQINVTPEAVLARRKIKKRGRMVEQVLIKWMNLSPENATWEEEISIKSQFPKFDPND